MRSDGLRCGVRLLSLAVQDGIEEIFPWPHSLHLTAGPLLKQRVRTGCRSALTVRAARRRSFRDDRLPPDLGVRKCVVFVPAPA